MAHIKLFGVVFTCSGCGGVAFLPLGKVLVEAVRAEDGCGAPAGSDRGADACREVRYYTNDGSCKTIRAERACSPRPGAWNG